MSNGTEAQVTGVSRWWRDYSEEPQPLGAYAILLAAYWSLFGLVALLARVKHRRLPRRVGASDIALLGLATHKVTRLATKDWVTSPLRAPFVQYEASTGAGEVSERSRGQGMRRALGDLFT